MIFNDITELVYSETEEEKLYLPIPYEWIPLLKTFTGKVEIHFQPKNKSDGQRGCSYFLSIKTKQEQLITTSNYHEFTMPNIQKPYCVDVKLNLKEFKARLNTLKILSDETFAQCKFELLEEQLKFGLQNKDTGGKGEVMVNCTYDNQDMAGAKFILNIKYLLEALQNLTIEEITLSLEKEFTPVLKLDAETVKIYIATIKEMKEKEGQE